MSLIHGKVATIPDDPSFEVGKDEWNEEHKFPGAGAGEIVYVDGSNHAATSPNLKFDAGSGTLTVGAGARVVGVGNAFDLLATDGSKVGAGNGAAELFTPTAHFDIGADLGAVAGPGARLSGAATSLGPFNVAFSSPDDSVFIAFDPNSDAGTGPKYTFGADHADSDKLKIGTKLGFTEPFFVVDASRLLTLGGGLTPRANTAVSVIPDPFVADGALFAGSGSGISAAFQTSATDGSNASPTVDVLGNTAQTANLQNWRGTDGTTVVASVDINGTGYFGTNVVSPLFNGPTGGAGVTISGEPSGQNNIGLAPDSPDTSQGVSLQAGGANGTIVLTQTNAGKGLTITATGDGVFDANVDAATYSVASTPGQSGTVSAADLTTQSLSFVNGIYVGLV